jgi:GDPmannose 4,6-dehydratase
MLNQSEPKEYILSSGEAHSVREFISLAFKSAGIEGEWKFVKGLEPINEQYLYINHDSIQPLIIINPEFYRPAEVDLLLGDSTPARTQLNWNPKISFTDLVKLMVENDLNLENCVN